MNIVKAEKSVVYTVELTDNEIESIVYAISLSPSHSSGHLKVAKTVASGLQDRLHRDRTDCVSKLADHLDSCS